MDFEKLGSFYLGKKYDVEAGQLQHELLMYDARDLTTHALCVGMTGSGKTGLCVDLLEEAALDDVPALIIDVKGDLTNLLLAFPELRPEDFRPWINPDDARRKGLTPDLYAGHQSDLWRSGLKQWGQDPSRISALVDSVDRVIYTPGSQAGVPVSMLQSFAAPLLDWEEEAELLRDRIQGIVGGLLGLLGRDADPVNSRESIFLANLFEHSWREGNPIDLASLINAIQNPPIRKMGVVDVDTFFPPKDRFELAMALNGIMASPAFRSWLEGQPLDIPSLLATPEGKPRHSIFYIAHLSDTERMFFVTMLLNQLALWEWERSILWIAAETSPRVSAVEELWEQAREDLEKKAVAPRRTDIDVDFFGLVWVPSWHIEYEDSRGLSGTTSILGVETSSPAGEV